MNSVIILDYASCDCIQIGRPPITNIMKDIMKKCWISPSSVIKNMQWILNILKWLNISKFKVFNVDRVLVQRMHVVCVCLYTIWSLTQKKTFGFLKKDWVVSKFMAFKLHDMKNLAKDKLSLIRMAEWVLRWKHVDRIKSELHRAWACNANIVGSFITKTGSCDSDTN